MADRACRYCPEKACITQGFIPLCEKHYRFQQMRMKSMTLGKIVPTTEQLEAMLPDEMECPTCNVKMEWRLKNGGGRTITLQHDRCGILRLICQKCNSRHGKLPGDSFYKLPPNTWRCRRCGHLLPIEDFGVEKRLGRMRRKTYCPPCTREYLREWERRNPLAMAAIRARKNAKRRARRALYGRETA